LKRALWKRQSQIWKLSKNKKVVAGYFPIRKP
jgi:hypothetical protein